LGVQLLKVSQLMLQYMRHKVEQKEAVQASGWGSHRN
jgi:hypothetical protein